MNETCPICGFNFHGSECPHSVSDVERHNNPPPPRYKVIKMEKPDPARQTTVHVPEAAMHVFVPTMDQLNAADEIWGVPDTEDYIALMEALKAEVEARLVNARALRERGL